MPIKKSEIVKASIKLKNGALQLEGPQAFVEKYLDPIIKKHKPFSKAFPKPEPTKKERVLITLTNNTADIYYSFLLGISAVAVTSFQIGNNSIFYVALALFIVFFVIAFYLKCLKRWTWKRDTIVNQLSKMRIQMKFMSWSLGITAIGISLINLTDIWIARLIFAVITLVVVFGFIIKGVLSYENR
jgi:hypothetical protein